MIRMTSMLGVAGLLVISPAVGQEVDTKPSYPFESFVGEWTLKDDTFRQVWDGETEETLSIPGHHTRCDKVNTGGTILCEVDAVDFQGHILWAYDASDETVSHLSHFGTSRLGKGRGAFNDQGDLILVVRFSDEPAGTLRIYAYKWVSENEYTMMSTQYNADETPTGNWYGGTFVRVESANE